MKQRLKMNSTLMTVLALSLAHSTTSAATLATVNGKAITDDDLNHLVSNLPQVQRDTILKDQGARQQLIQNLVDQELLSQEAAAKKMDETKEYKEALNNFKKTELVNLLVQRQLTGKVTDSVAKDYYKKHKINYTTDQVRAQHILLTSDKDAQEVLSEVRKPGADFQAIAEKKSKDPSVKNNRGDVGFFTHEMFDPAFSNAAFGTKVGEITGPVKTLFGYHIIKVVERKGGKTPEFVEIEQKVRSDIQREMLQDYVSKLRKKAKITKQ